MAGLPAIPGGDFVDFGVSKHGMTGESTKIDEDVHFFATPESKDWVLEIPVELCIGLLHAPYWIPLRGLAIAVRLFCPAPEVEHGRPTQGE